MDSYLKGRGFKSDSHDSGISTEFKSLGSLMELSKFKVIMTLLKVLKIQMSLLRSFTKKKIPHLLKLFL